MNFYFMELFLPASLIVIVGWMASLRINYAFTDLLSVLLALLFLYFTYLTFMPRVSDVKAMDIFLATCLLFIFALIVHMVVIRESNFPRKPKTMIVINKDVPWQELSVDGEPKRKLGCFYIFFPVAFGLFCFCYIILFTFILHDDFRMNEVCGM